MKDEQNDRIFLRETKVFCISDRMFVVEFVCKHLTPTEMLRSCRRSRRTRGRLGKRGKTGC